MKNNTKTKKLYENKLCQTQKSNFTKIKNFVNAKYKETNLGHVQPIKKIYSKIIVIKTFKNKFKFR